MLQEITNEIIEKTKQEARLSKRGRAIHRFHATGDRLQRMINVLLHDTYVQPHRHLDPPKLEHFLILEGRIACFEFDIKGNVEKIIIMDAHGPIKGVYILPGSIHSLVCLSDEAVVSEIIDGKYDPNTHKEYMSFAPPENTVEAVQYLQNLKAIIGKDNHVK